MAYPNFTLHQVTAIAAQRLIFDSFVELKLTITDSDGNTNTVSLMSPHPVEVQMLPFRDVRKVEAVPA